MLAAAEAEVAAWQGRLDEAAAAAVADGLAALQGPLADLRACMLLAIGLRVEADRVALAVARHDPATVADARLVAAELLRWAGGTLDGSEVAWQRALLATCEAEWARAQGEVDPEGWLAAVAAWEDSGHPYPLAMARWRAAEALLARRGDRALAADLLRRAHEVAVALGAAPLRGELERLARLGRVDLRPDAAADAGPDDGLGRGRAGPGGRAAARGRARPDRPRARGAGPGGRGPQQPPGRRRPVHQRQDGQRARVNILAKLGVASRVEAAAVAHRLDLLDRRPRP